MWTLAAHTDDLKPFCRVTEALPGSSWVHVGTRTEPQSARRQRRGAAVTAILPVGEPSLPLPPVTVTVTDAAAPAGSAGADSESESVSGSGGTVEWASAGDIEPP